MPPVPPPTDKQLVSAMLNAGETYLLALAHEVKRSPAPDGSGVRAPATLAARELLIDAVANAIVAWRHP